MANAMPHNARTARAGRRLRRQAGAVPRRLAGTNVPCTSTPEPTAPNAKYSDAMPYNVRTARIGQRHRHRHRRPGAVPRLLAGTDLPGTSTPGPTAPNAKYSDAMPYNVRTARIGQRHRHCHRQAGAVPRLLAGTDLPGSSTPGPTAPNAKSSDAMPYNVRTARTGCCHRPTCAVPPLLGRANPSGTSTPGPTASNAKSSDAMPYNVRTAGAGRHHRRPARSVRPILAGTNPPEPTASNTKNSDAMPYNVRTAHIGRRLRRQAHATPRRTARARPGHDDRVRCKNLGIVAQGIEPRPLPHARWTRYVRASM